MADESIIFVFGSNEAGMHGAGAALTATQNFGAIMGIGAGPSGRSYAIPTKDRRLVSLPIARVKQHVDAFMAYALYTPEETFKVTQIGCGLAGFTGAQIAPLFERAPSNCYFDLAWQPFLSDRHRFWGTFDARAD